ncbi:MAG: ShlB/FhaC/HecB family hemolysin secretion/activation protein [Myxococcota bacterium]
MSLVSTPIGMPLLLVGLALLAPERAAGQAFPFERPGDEPLELPDVTRPPEKPEFELPSLPEPAPKERERLPHQPSLVVREFEVEGNTVFTPERLREVMDPYLGHPITSEDLHRLRDELTRLYVDAGYVNSGAILPDQEVTDGVVRYQIVEGRLARIDVAGNRWFRERYLRDRLERGAATPLDVDDLEAELQILQQDPRIRRVRAELTPGARRGEAILKARFDEVQPLRAWIQADNYEPPSVGAFGGRLRLAHENLSGNGDVLESFVGLTEGYQNYEGRYSLPVTTADTLLRARFTYNENDVVEKPFEVLDISSTSETIGLGLTQPVHRSLRHRVELFVDAEVRKSETFLGILPGDDRFSFVAGPEKGVSKLSIVRLGQLWVYRDLDQAIAVRSQASVGLDLFDATHHSSSSIPDGQFFAWLGQAQWVRRFEPWGLELLLRGDVQLASAPLLSLEQFSLGGHATVRGYRENEVVRDNGLVGSVELRLPIWRDEARGLRVDLAPFFDMGKGWNHSDHLVTVSPPTELDSRTLTSIGVGLRVRLGEHLFGQITWGEQLRDVPTAGEHDLQDSGIQFQVRVSY